MGDGQVVAQVGVVGNLDGFDLVFIAGADAVLLAGGYQEIHLAVFAGDALPHLTGGGLHHTHLQFGDFQAVKAYHGHFEQGIFFRRLHFLAGMPVLENSVGRGCSGFGLGGKQAGQGEEQ